MSNEIVPYRPKVISPDIKRVTPNMDIIKRPDVIDADYKVLPKTKDVVLVGITVDDSASIKTFGNIENVIKGHNDVIAALEKNENIRFKTQLFNEQGALNNWIPIADARKLTGPDKEGNEGNYKTDSDTPLYDASYKILDNAMTVRQDIIMKDRKPARFGVMIISDGEDTSSKKYKAKDVENKVKQIIEENSKISPNTISFMGMPNNTGVNYTEIANSMGIENQRPNTRSELVMQILTPESNPTSIRRAFEIFSKPFTGGNR